MIATREINPGRVFEKHPFLRNGYSFEQKEIPEEIFIGEFEFEGGPTTFQENPGGLIREWPDHTIGPGFRTKEIVCIPK